ncbi:MAG: lipoyl synthase [Candidatus Norongarragalinales archaeon]
MQTHYAEQKPSWLKIRPPKENFEGVKATLRQLGLVTVCEEAHCPNASECWSSGTATFMVLGSICTRGCHFCSVGKGIEGQPIDVLEPWKIASAVRKWGLDYVVITSVDRDDLPDQGAEHFAKCIRAIRKHCEGVLVEVLIPDFRGDEQCLKTIVEAKPDVIAHNVETVEELQRVARDMRAGYAQSLGVLENVKKMDSTIFTKSSIMLGMGEQDESVLKTMDDLRSVKCDFITFGQYLRPTERELPVFEYVAPEKFGWFKTKALEKGFLYCASGPFVRSSYKAGELFVKALKEKQMVVASA